MAHITLDKDGNYVTNNKKRVHLQLEDDKLVQYSEPKNNVQETQKSSKELKNIYNKNNNDLYKESNNLKNKYKSAGIAIDSGYIPSVSNKTYLETEQPKYSTSYKEGIEESKKGLVNTYANKTKENVQKFKDFSNTKDIKNQTELVNDMYDKTAHSYVDYLQQKVNEDDIGWYDKSIGMVVNGIIAPLTIGKYSLKNENEDNYTIPTYNDLKQQKVMNSYKTGAGKILGGAAFEIGRQATSLALNSIAPGLGTTAYFGSMFTDSWNNAIKEGYDSDKSLVYATLSTGLEMATERVLGGATKSIFGTGTSELSESISKGLSKVITNHPKIVSAMSNAISEGGEEFIQEYLDRVNKNIVLGSKEKAFSKETFEDAIYSAAVGMITGGINGAISPNSYSTRESSLLTEINENKNYVDKLTEKRNKNLADISKVNRIDNKILQSQKEINNLVNDLDNYYQKNNIVNNSNNENGINLPGINHIKAPQNNNQNNIFSKQIDEVLQGKYPKRDMLIVSQNTPKVFQDLGLKDLPITMTQKHLYTMTNSEGKYVGANYHNISTDIIKQLPDALEHPLNISKSDTKDGSVVAITELADNNGDIIVASIKIDGKGTINDIRIDSNVMTSAYGKSGNYDYWMQDNIKKGNLLYDIDEGIINKIDDNNNAQKKSDVKDRLQLPMRDSSRSTTSDIPKNISPIHYSNDTTNNIKNQVAPLPINNNIQKFTNNTDNFNLSLKNIDKADKTQDPIEISNLTKENANTTPNLPIINRNEVNDGNSKFYNNIKDKVGMLNEQQKHYALSNEEVQFYDKVTNKESLNKAFDRMNKNGKLEITRWFNSDSKSADSTDVAEGWILLKQYADNNQYDDMVEVAKKMRDIGTKAGQTVQAFNIMERMTPEGMVKYAQSELIEAYNQMVKNKSKEWIDKYRNDFDLKPDEVQFIIDNMKEVSSMKDGYEKKVKLAEIQKLMTDKLPPQKGSKIKSWMRISMLFNPKTQVRNVVGNALIMPINNFSDLFSSYADKLISRKTNVRTTGNVNIKAQLKGFKDGAYQATNDYKKGINTKDMEGNRFEIGEGKSFNDKKLIGKSLNRVEGLLNYIMDVGDRVFSQSAFENSLQNQLILNNTTEVTADMIDIARTESLQRTWNDNNNYTKFVLDIRRKLNRIGTEKYGLGDILIPFAKTPANLTKAIVDYSPVGLVNSLIQGNNLRKSLSNGQFTPQMQHKFVQTLGKATAGTMLYVLGIGLAKAGITSGESEDDKDTANFLKNTLGISSYSIKIGNKSFTYDWAQPIAAPLSITANIVNSKNKDKALFEAIISNLDTAGNILLEQSFLQSINEVLDDNKGVISGLMNSMLDLPARAIPTFSKQIVDMVDGTQRTTFEYGKPVQTALNKMAVKIPGLSKKLAPSIDTMGREKQKYGGKNNIFNVFLNPANVNIENISESAKEIYRLYKEVGDKSIMPRVASYYLNKKGEKITFTSEQRADYQKASGRIVENNVRKLLNSTEYKNLSDDKKSEVVKKIVDYSYNIAQKEVLNIDLSDAYQKAYDYSKIGNISDYYTFKNSIDENNKKESISDYLINSNLDNKQLAMLYGNYYSSKETLNNLLTMNIPIKEYIKLNSENIEGDYNTKTGKTISDSEKNKVINYVNSLKLSIPQKAILIKSQYSSYKNYDKEIINYVNNIKISANKKKILLKSIGFDNWDNDIVQYVKSNYKTVKEREQKLKSLGFTIRDGRVYW